jgi:F-type H+-transporting ATPase subunit b
MLIDWFTVVAQTINFLILVWLLKRFLYQPILDAIDAREQRIAQVLADAEVKKGEARQERDEFERRNREFAEQREALFRQMQDEVQVARQKLLDDARAAADSLSAKRQEALQREQQSFGEEIRRRTQDHVCSITRKTLKDLADTSLEERITSVFMRRIRELNGDAALELGKALTTSSNPARVRSAFELSAEQQSGIQQTLREKFATDIPVRFETGPDLVGGIELTASGRQVAWSIDDYLKSLAKSIAELTEARMNPDAESEPV